MKNELSNTLCCIQHRPVIKVRVARRGCDLGMTEYPQELRTAVETF